MSRRLISSAQPLEGRFGYSRAVVCGRNVHVSGTAPTMPQGVEPPPDAYGQAQRCLEIIVEALREAGAGPGDVVRTRTFLTSAEHWEDVTLGQIERLITVTDHEVDRLRMRRQYLRQGRDHPVVPLVALGLRQAGHGHEDLFSPRLVAIQ